MKWLEQNNSLTKEFIFENFVEACNFIQTIIPIAESMNHHPDIYLHSYNKVKIILTTHSQKQVTQKDHKLAGQIDHIIQEVNNLPQAKQTL